MGILTHMEILLTVLDKSDGPKSLYNGPLLFADHRANLTGNSCAETSEDVQIPDD